MARRELSPATHRREEGKEEGIRVARQKRIKRGAKRERVSGASRITWMIKSQSSFSVPRVNQY